MKKVTFKLLGDIDPKLLDAAMKSGRLMQLETVTNVERTRLICTGSIMALLSLSHTLGVAGLKVVVEYVSDVPNIRESLRKLVNDGI